MSSDVKKPSDIETVAADNMGGHIVAVPGSTSANATEKRTLPLLYVQSSINKSNIGDSSNESVIPINVPKFGGPVAVSSVPNGVAAGAKLVQVQTPNQNIAYVGTLFKHSNKGKDMVPQKVLLTPVKGKEVSMARLILPRPTAPSSQGIIPGKKICRSFVVSPVTQTSLIKPNDSTSAKLVQPNIIRPRGVEAKILTNAVIKPASVTKATVPPGLTLVKGPQIQAQGPGGDKAQMKVILVDMKEDVNDKVDAKVNDVAKANKVSPPEDSSKNENSTSSNDIVTIEDENEKADKTSIKSTESESEVSKPVSSNSSENEKTTNDNKTTAMQWDEKESSSPFPSSGDRARKRKGSLMSSTAGTPKKIHIGDPYENIKLFPGGEEYDPFKIIDWDSQGLGNLPDSSIKIVKNEFDMVELLDGGDPTDKKKTDEIFCCLSCGCYGLITEFYNENYCSISCRDDLIALQHSIFKKDSDVEMTDSNDKKKVSENVSAKTTAVPNDAKPSERKMSTEEEAPVTKSNESDIIDLIDASSPDSESSVKKAVVNDDIRLTKIKKIITKGYKINRKTELLKPASQISPDKLEKQTKIKLRPRASGKMNKSSSTEDIIAQDLDLGSANNDNDSPSKKKTRFRWNAYLSETKSSGAWVKLFNNPFPSRPNRFKVGQRLEAIDPEHQSNICLVSVAEVKGYRLKLHFDGYPKDYDFWINADNPNLFPSEFCSKHKIPLRLPPALSAKHFDWDTYLSRNNAKAAPQSCFENNSSNYDQVNLFKVDMKLEAVDRKNTFLVCVSTVAAVMENRILVHFDSWDDMYDYWVDISSPYIRPVGWCKNANHELTPPNGIKPEDFSWKKYLKETRSVAAPEKAFVLRPPIEFKKGLKIEAVDKRAPHLIRVATIAEVLPYQVKITFDGFPAHFGYWVDDDCSDIHPVGWSSRAGHPLEPPPTAEDFLNSSCPTPGCIGQGYFHGTRKETHKLAKNCPYTTENLVKDSALTDRLKWSTKAIRRNSEDVINLSDDSAEESDDEPAELKWAWMKMRQGLKNGVTREKGPDYVDDLKDDEGSHSENEMTDKKESSPELPKEESIKTEEYPVKKERSPSIDKNSNDDDSSKNSLISEEVSMENSNGSVKVKEEKSEDEIPPVKPSDEPKSMSPLKTNSENVSTLNGNNVSKDNCSTVSIITEEGCQNENNPLYWSIHQVSKFTRPLISSAKDCFLEEEIDGQGLLMLSKSDLLDYLGLSDSDAERVYSSIILLRQKAVL